MFKYRRMLYCVPVLQLRDLFKEPKQQKKVDGPIQRMIRLEPGKRDVEIIIRNEEGDSERKTVQRAITFEEPDPFAIASAPGLSPCRKNGERPHIPPASGNSTATPCR